MKIAEVLGVLGFIAGIPSVWLSLHNLKRGREDRRRLNEEFGERKAVADRAVRLIQELPAADSKSRGQQDFLEFRLGADPILDKAVRLAHEWRAVFIRWNAGSYQVRLRTLSEPPDPEQKYGWF